MTDEEYIRERIAIQRLMRLLLFVLAVEVSLVFLWLMW
jgi:hypothetical protein